VYLTDGVFLFRVIGLVPDVAGEMVELEDCYGLDVVQVSVSDLHARGLRVVTPAPGVASRRGTLATYMRDSEPSSALHARMHA
jgi:hypothetical protein